MNERAKFRVALGTLKRMILVLMSRKRKGIGEVLSAFAGEVMSFSLMFVHGEGTFEVRFALRTLEVVDDLIVLIECERGVEVCEA